MKAFIKTCKTAIIHRYSLTVLSAVHRRLQPEPKLRQDFTMVMPTTGTMLTRAGTLSLAIPQVGYHYENMNMSVCSGGLYSIVHGTNSMWRL